MNRFGFNELNEDNQLELLKYMPIKERVGFERINSSWASLLDTLWLSQKQLRVGSSFGNSVGCHLIGLNDQYQRDDMPVEVLLKVISRCKNLKALETSTDAFDDMTLATRLATVLNNCCKELEHFKIWTLNMVFFEQFIPSDKFTCLIPLTYGCLNILYDKNEPAHLLPLKSICFRRVADAVALILINKLSVQYLVTSDWGEKYYDCINLKSLDLWERSDQIGSFKQLEHIRLVSTNTEMRRIFENNRKLVSLEYREAAENIMPTILQFGLNLKKLHLEFTKVAMLNDYQFWQNLAELTKLRSLTIHAEEFEDHEVRDLDTLELNVVDAKLDVMGLILLLKACNKLKLFEFTCYSNVENITTEVEKEQLRKVVAIKSFRQSFVVNFTSCEDSHGILVKVG